MPAKKLSVSVVLIPLFSSFMLTAHISVRIAVSVCTKISTKLCWVTFVRTSVWSIGRKSPLDSFQLQYTFTKLVLKVDFSDKTSSE